MIAVLLAALAGFATGAIWYMSLSRPWMAAAQIEADETGKPKGGSFVPFIYSGAAMILVAGMMRHMFAMAGIDGAGAGFVAGIGIGAFFITPWLAMCYAYGMRKPVLALIDGGYACLGCAVIGAVLGAM